MRKIIDRLFESMVALVVLFALMIVGLAFVATVRNPSTVADSIVAKPGEPESELIHPGPNNQHRWDWQEARFREFDARLEAVEAKIAKAESAKE